MIIDKTTFDGIITEKYYKWIADTARLTTKGNTDEAAEIINDLIEYTYRRIENNGGFECKNIDGYIYRGARFSKISKSSPYQRKRGGQFINVPLSDIFKELNENKTYLN